MIYIKYRNVHWIKTVVILGKSPGCFLKHVPNPHSSSGRETEEAPSRQETVKTETFSGPGIL